MTESTFFEPTLENPNDVANAIEYADSLGGASSAFGKTIIYHSFLSASTAGSNCFLALYLTSPTDDDVGTEVPYTWGGYKRIGISGSFSVNKSTGSACNNQTISFPVASGSWGNVKYWGIRNGSWVGYSGSLLFWGPVGGFSYAPSPEEVSASPGVWGAQRNINFGRYVGPSEQLIFSASNIKIRLWNAYTPVFAGSILNHYLNNIRLSASSIVAYAGLFQYPTDSDSITSGSTEITNTGYERKQITGAGAGTLTWATPGKETSASHITFNEEDLIFTYKTLDSWRIDGTFFVTNTTGGEILYTMPFNETLYVSPSGGFMFSASNLKIQLE